MSDYAKIAQEIIPLIADEWRKQGHTLTGKFEKSIEYIIEQKDNIVNIKFIDGTKRGYGAILERGVPARNIPFAPGSGAGKSAYITGLYNYVKLRIAPATDREALSIAFAIAYTHKREGMPSVNSRKYSSTGKRIGFTADAFTKIERIIKNNMVVLIKKKIVEQLLNT